MRMKVVLFLSCFAAAAQEPLLFGPYIQQVQTDAATVMWVTSGPQVTMTGGEETILREEYRTHRARFDHLKPDTEYSYTLEGGLSGKFRTAPAEPAAFRFVAYG
ncbi:MAG: hypothetical protein HYZ00_11590, partial [Candidatus Hydrogenedentes bacterium]|nr:hypothetical protein [Candidatus Hydrogenedentota bacterium]